MPTPIRSCHSFLSTESPPEFGYFYWFLRLPGPMGMGHMGWGLQLAKDYFLHGSLENTGGDAHVPQSGDSDYWMLRSASEAEMIHTMCNPHPHVTREIDRDDLSPYTHYKKQFVDNPDPKAAFMEATDVRWNGYVVVGANCLDNSIMVANAYGARNRDWARHVDVRIASPKVYWDNYLERLTAFPLVPDR